ncbi:hypothetical protein KY320_03085 [Candidatus Woesearchaeota archaeon]|nr:hypothetical protein [Candidatus Woesearchaeota archaeon]
MGETNLIEALEQIALMPIDIVETQGQPKKPRYFRYLGQQVKMDEQYHNLLKDHDEYNLLLKEYLAFFSRRDATRESIKEGMLESRITLSMVAQSALSLDDVIEMLRVVRKAAKRGTLKPSTNRKQANKASKDYKSAVSIIHRMIRDGRGIDDYTQTELDDIVRRGGDNYHSARYHIICHSAEEPSQESEYMYYPYEDQPSRITFVFRTSDIPKLKEQHQKLQEVFERARDELKLVYEAGRQPPEHQEHFLIQNVNHLYKIVV